MYALQHSHIAKKYIDQDFPWLMRTFCVLNWEEITTKIRPLCRLWIKEFVIIPARNDSKDFA